MNYELILIRYGELSLKTRYVRNYFETTLIRNIKQVFKQNKTKCTIQRERGRIYLYTEQIDRGTKILKNVFGITSISPAIETKTDIDIISKTAIQISKKQINKDKTFAIKTTRTGEHDFSSQDISIRIGNDIVKETGAGVDLTKPDFKLFIEIRNNKTFIFTEKMKGMGGLPIGTQGKVLAYIDTPQSLLAAWYLMRRGCKTIFIKTKKIDEKNLINFISKWDKPSEIIEIDDEEKKLYDTLNNTALEKNCEALVTGYSLYENQKNALIKINSFKENIKLPVLHPLISMDEKIINEKCKRIGIQI